MLSLAPTLRFRLGGRNDGFSGLSRPQPPLVWFESLTKNGLRCYSGWGLDSRFHGNDGVGPLAVRMVREPQQERTPSARWSGSRASPRAD